MLLSAMVRSVLASWQESRSRIGFEFADLPATLPTTAATIAKKIIGSGMTCRWQFG